MLENNPMSLVILQYGIWGLEKALPQWPLSGSIIKINMTVTFIWTWCCCRLLCYICNQTAVTASTTAIVTSNAESLQTIAAEEQLGLDHLCEEYNTVPSTDTVLLMSVFLQATQGLQKYTLS